VVNKAGHLPSNQILKFREVLENGSESLPKNKTLRLEQPVFGLDGLFESMTQLGAL
jgi:hypothetical protein